MQRKCKKSGILRILLFFMLFMLAIGSTVSVQAATRKNGFVKEKDGYTYYYVDGVKKTGWLTYNGKKYYFYSGSGRMATGYVTNSAGQKRYFYKGSGIMATGWVENSTGGKRYFDPETGFMATGWVEYPSTGKKRYFSPSSGLMATGWLENTAGKRYFSTVTGYMTTGWKTYKSGKQRYFYESSGYMAQGAVKSANGKYRYFSMKTGYLTSGYVKDEVGTRYYSAKTFYMLTGWQNQSKGTRYYDPETGYYVKDKTIMLDGYECKFDSNGILTSKKKPMMVTPTNGKTIKNYLAGAIQPVGQALYVWGGGWTDATLKGVSPAWKNWYDYQSGAYDYNYYRDLSASTRSKGLDCSGFVGWAAYQVMHSTSGVGSGYTVVSGDVGFTYANRGWGSILTQADLMASDYTFKPGDVGYNSGHTWIVVGQCEDKSLVIVHSTPNAGCQIAGTPKPDGQYYGSQAIELAKQYMSKFAGYTKFDYHTSSGHYIKNGNYLRWNRATLADPEGYCNMTADQILADLFSGR